VRFRRDPDRPGNTEPGLSQNFISFSVTCTSGSARCAKAGVASAHNKQRKNPVHREHSSLAGQTGAESWAKYGHLLPPFAG
jgi:hypothetical protein